jgi:FMN-dependent NADH-azoreductase
MSSSSFLLKNLVLSISLIISRPSASGGKIKYTAARFWILTKRDVTQQQPPHLNQETVTRFFDDTAYSENIQFSDEFIDELYKSDEILITCPMYNYGISSSLKAYFDHVVRTKRTFTYDNGINGLLVNKKASIISTMGNLQSLTGELNPMEIYLTSILNQLGITDISYFPLDGMVDPNEAEKKIEFQQNRIDEYLTPELV